MELKEYIEIYYNIIYKFNSYYSKCNENNIDIYKIGISTVTHIFKFSLILKKNIIEICENSIYYFFEFISQVKNSSDDYLHLQSRDATIFIFKKFFDENLYYYSKENETKINKTTYNCIESITSIFIDAIFFYSYSINNANHLFKQFILNLTNLNIDQLKLFHYYLPVILKNIPLKQFNRYNISLIHSIKSLNKKQIIHLNNNIFKFKTTIKPSIAIKEIL